MSELDDFFAKKDRKKSKGRKSVSAEDKGKGKSDEANKKTDKGVKKERIPREDGEDGSIPEQEADEWKEFEEEKKDYSGLKLGHLSISDNATAEGCNAGDIGEDGSNDGGGDVDEGGNDGETSNERSHGHSQRSGPWKRVNQQQPQKEKKTATDSNTNGQQDKQPEEEQTMKRATGAYVPPGLRNPQLRGSPSSGASGSQQLQPMRLRGLRATAPDIHNEDYFPTLAAGTPGGAASKDKQGAFEIVSHGRSGGGGNSAQSSRVTPTSGLRTSTSGQQQQSQQLTLGNRFNTLSQNDS